MPVFPSLLVLEARMRGRIHTFSEAVTAHPDGTLIILEGKEPSLQAPAPPLRTNRLPGIPSSNPCADGVPTRMKTAGVLKRSQLADRDRGRDRGRDR